MASDLQVLKELEQLLGGSSAKFTQKCQQSIPRIAKLMKGDLSDVEVQRRCVAVLKEYCYENESSASHLPSTEVFPLLFTVLKHHHSQPTVVLQVFGLFVNLTVVESNRTLISEKGGIASTLQIMGKLASNEEVQRMGMMVLRNMSCDAPSCQQEIAVRHGVELLFQAANRYQQNPDIAEQFVATLLHLSHTIEACQGIVEQGGIHLFLELTGRPTEYPPGLVEMAVAVLVNLSLVPEALDALVVDGCVPAMVQAAQQKEGGPVVRRAVQVLGNLACSDDLRELVLKHGALAAVVGAMQRHKGDADGIRVASWALCNLVAGNKAAQRELAVSLAGVSLAINLFQRYSQDKEILLNCCKLLWTLCYAVPELQEDASKQVMPALMSTLEANTQDKEVLEELLSLLANLARNPKTHPDFQQAQGPKVLAEVLKANRSIPPVVLLCFRLLTSVAEVGEGPGSEVLADLRLVAFVLKGVQGCKDDHEIQRKGCKLLALLLGRHPALAEAVVARKGLEGVVHHARDNWEVPGLLRYYLSVLLNVSINEANHRALVDAGAMDLALRALEERRDSVDVAKRCLWLLGNLCGGGHDLAAEHWPLVLRAMEVHWADAEVQLGGAGILDVLTSEEGRLEALAAEGVLDAVTAALVQHGGHGGVQLRGLEVLLNFATSRQRSHRALVPAAALDHLLQALDSWPANVVLLGFRVLGELADVQQAHLQAQDAVGGIQRAMEAHGADAQVQADGAAALCRIAAATEDWAVLVRGNVLAGLLSLQRCDPHPSVQRACSWAFRALPSIPSGVDTLLQAEAAVPTLLQMAAGSGDDEVRETVMLTIAQVVWGAAPEALQPHAEGLLALRAGPLGDTGDARLLACLCVLDAALLAKQLRAGSEDEAKRVLGLLERCQGSDPCDFHDLHLAAGLPLAALLVEHPLLRPALLQIPSLSDTTWKAAQDLQRCPDVIADYGLGEPPLALCRQALDVLLQAQPLTESAAEGAGSMPEREDRQARRQAVAEARSQLAVEDRREHGKKSRNERRQVSSTAFQAGDIPEEETILSSSDGAPSPESPGGQGGAVDGERAVAVKEQGEEDPVNVAARLEMEDAEAWARYHIEMDALEARRRIGVRMAQHRKALAERGSAMTNMMQTWYCRILDETSASTLKEDELRLGTSYLQAAADLGPPRRPALPLPPPPADELVLGRSPAPAEEAEAPPASPPPPKPMTIGAAAAFSPAGKRRAAPLHLRNVIGWETLVSKARPRPADAMPDASGGNWGEASPVRRTSPPADHQAPGTSTLPGYIYFQRAQEAFAVHPPAVQGTNFRSVAIRSSLPVA